MKTRMIFVLVYVAAVLGACNKGSEAGLDISPEKQGVDVPAFQGNWRSDACTNWGGNSYQLSGRQYLTIKGSMMESYSKDYTSNDCSGDIRSILKFKFKFDLAAGSLPGWHNIDVVAIGMYQTVYDQDAANAFNTSAYCGYTDWLIGVEKDISGKDCMSGTQINQTLYSSVRITDTEIQLAEDDKINDGTTPEKRHKTPGAILKKSAADIL